MRHQSLMTKIEVSRLVGVTHDRVWGALSDLGGHTEWMKDAERIEFTSDRTTGIGTTMNIETRVGPLRTIDVVTVTGWAEGESIEIAHRGLVTGAGGLSAAPVAEGTVVTWVEDLTFPWWLGGPITAWLARPILTRVFRGNLERLEELLSAP